MRKFLPKLVLLLFTFYILHATVYSSYAYAQEDNIGQSQITPASPLYFVKSIREILELKFAGTGQAKTYRQLEFATRRIREVKSLVNTSHQDLIQPTLIRYLYHLQELKDMVNIHDEVTIGQVMGEINLHMKVLQTIYQQVSDRRARMSIRSTVHRVSLWDQELIDKLNELGKPHLADKITKYKLQGCAFLFKEASSSALNEVERFVFSERAKKCLIPKL